MINTENYIVDTDSVAEVVEFRRGDKILLCKGKRKEDNLSVLVKSFCNRFPSSVDLERLRQEYELCVTFKGCSNLLSILEFKTDYLIYSGIENFVLLSNFFSAGPPSINTVLQIGVQLCDGLSHMHKRLILHGSLNPESIIINPLTNEIKIFDFSYACFLKENRPKPLPIPGQDLTYTSPEQTGRYGHSVDFRADMYSLGIILYTLIAGSPPFGDASKVDPVDLIHSHIAKPPPLLHISHPSIPLAISQVIHKLIEKSPELRYQSAIGARNDLVHCLHDAELGQSRRVFELGTSDVMPAPQVSKVIIDREQEQKIIMDVLNRETNNVVLVQVTGPLGIGKTSLVRTVLSSWTEGVYASGKYEEETGRPYDGLITCIRSLLMQTMGHETQQAFMKWKPRLIKLCGPNTEILLEALPELAPLLGPPMPLEDLPPRERRVRFHMLLIGIIKMIAEEHRICLFIDDLNNADLSSLELIVMLLTQCSPSRLTFVVTYRDKCLADPTHPLTITMPMLEQFNPKTLKLIPLAAVDTEKILAGALSNRDDSGGDQALRALTTAIQAKTDGNPLYVTRFLSQLHQAGIIKWNWERVGWEWDIVAVNTAHFLADTEHWLSASQLFRITPELKRMLQVAAVAGGTLPVKALVELAHLFLEDFPPTPVGDDGSVGGDSDDEEIQETNSSVKQTESAAIRKIASPNPLRRSGPPSLTPVASVSSPAVAGRQLSPSPVAGASRVIVPSTPPNEPQVKPPNQQHIERGNTPSQIDNLVRAFPSDNTENTSCVTFLSTSTKPPTITPPATPPISPPTLPRFSLMSPSKSIDPLQKQPHKVRRMDSFPRVQSLEEYSGNRQSKLQRSLGSQQFATSPPDPNVIRRRMSADYQPVPIINTKNLHTETTDDMNVTSPTLTSPMSLTSPNTPMLSPPPFSAIDPPSISSSSPAPNSPMEPDDRAWAHFPKKVEQPSGAVFRVTSHVLNRPSVLKNGNMEMTKNKKYTTIVLMLINEAVASSLLKETEEPNMHGEIDLSVTFTHERFRQSALLPVSKKFARQVHLEYGNLILNTGGDLYTAVTHLNYAKKLMTFEAKANLCSLNFKAGSAAKASGAHETALKFLKTGYDLVRPEEWKTDYSAVFALSLAYAECEFLSGDRVEATKMFEGLLTKAESVVDRARCYALLAQVLVSCGDYMEAVRVSCECCRYLGWDCKANPTNEDAVQYVRAIENALEDKTTEDLINLKQTFDERVISLLGILLSMLDITYFINMELFCVVSSKMVELTLEHGNCSLSTGGYSMLALAVAGLQLSPAFAYKVDQVAMALLVKYPCSTSVSIKAKIMHTFAMYSKHHLRDTLQFYEDAVKCGMHVGDFAYTVYAMIHKANTLYRTCAPLKELVEHGYQVYDFVANKAKFKDMAIMLAGVLYPAYALIGDSSVKPLLTTKDYEYLFNKSNPISSYNLTAAGWAAAGIMEGKYMEDKIDDAYEAALVAQKMKRGLKGSLGMVLLTFYHSLVAIAKFDKTRDHKLLGEVKENQQFLGWWAENCHINGHHQYTLVQAELMRVSGNPQEAMRLYEIAISHAHQHQYLNVEALAYELYAKHLLEQGFKVLASNSFTKAVEVYTIWGAMVKVDLLISRYGNLMNSLQHKLPSVEPLSYPQRTDLDMMIVVRALQMLSQGVESNSLLERFVTLVVQSASAEKGAVVLKGYSGGGKLLSSLGGFNKPQDLTDAELMKVAVFWDARTTDKPTVFQSRIPLTDYHELPSDIIQAVANTKQNVLIQNLSESDYNVRYAEAAPTSSIMCLPIFHNANEAVGVMYLENSASGVFNRERLQMIELLCSQLGILLQNTSLYESMQGSMQMYELLAESLPQMIFCHRSVDTVYYTNKLAQVYLGLTMDQLQLVFKYNFNETIHPDDYPEFSKAWTESFGKTVTLNAELRIKRSSDNTYRWCMMRSVPVLDRDGGTFMVSTVSDVDDEHKAKERQLRISRIEASEKRYRLLSEAIPHIIWTATQNGAAIFFNSKWVEYTGISLEESHGFGWYHAIHPDDLDNVRKAWGAINTERLDMKIRLRKWDGEYRWHLSRAIPCYEENSTNLVWFGTSTDINDTEVAAELLIKARETAEKAAANQALFLANMSHEIRTPLSGLTGMLDLLTDTPLNPEQHDYVDTMHHSAEGLLCIINDILDFSKIEAGKLQLQNEAFNPESAIEVVCEILSVMAATKDIELVFLVQPNVPPMLYGDPLRLRQVLMNLVGNAIKFTKTGEVSVECSLMERYEDSTALLFTVEDSGCGMSPDEQKSLFNAFYQVDPSITRTHGGTGLGLAICKRLVDLFNGTISVNSTKGVGSKFSFSANFKNVKDTIPKQPTPRHKHTLHILSVADTPSIRKVIRFHLQQHVEGLTIFNQEAYNLAQVKDILKKSTKTLQKFIVDVKYEQLPEVVSTIKAYIESNSSPPTTPSSPPKTPYFSPPRTPQSPMVATPNTPNFSPNPFLPSGLSTVSSSSSVSSSSTLANVPAIIIVTTSLKRSQYVKICADVLQGCHAQLRTLIKPITHTKLRVALATSPAELAATGGVEGIGVEEVDIAQSPPPIPRAPSIEKKNKSPILIVEDNEVNQKVIKRHVEKWGMKCEVASNGAEAVKLVTQDRPPNFYCLALMDLFMPNVDGFEATRLIREWEHARAPGTLTYSALPPPGSVTSPPLLSSPKTLSPVNTAPSFRNGYDEKEKLDLQVDAISMPRVNSGSDLKRHNSESNRLPIVVLTANVVGDIQEKIFHCGADAMLSKPIDFQKLRALVVHYSYISM